MTPRRMAERGIEVHVLPATATVDDVLAVGADGVFFSNGPGDPAAADRPGGAAAGRAGARHPVLRHLLRQPAARPGARASAPTSSSYGHRGINQPVLDRATGKVEVTAHNHGFAVDAPLDGSADDAVRARSRSATSASTTTSSRGCAASTCRRSRCSTTRRPPPARTTPAYLFDRFAELMPPRRRRLMPKRDRHRSVLVIGSGPDRHRPGLRVRLLRHPGLPGAARPRACGSSWSTPTRRRS